MHLSVALSYEYPRTFLDAIGLFADEELVGTCEDRFNFDFATLLSSPFLLLHPFRHRVEAACQAGIRTAAIRAEMNK